MGVLWVPKMMRPSWRGIRSTYQMISHKRKIDKILVANRGEIACRVMRTARTLGVKTVAVYSDADKNSMHVDMADESYHIGPANAKESYLNAMKLLEIAKRSQCKAIHPGYGFLSENAEFVEVCEKNRMVFIGPPASAIRDMGIKSTSKTIMSKAGVKVIEGYHGIDQSEAKLKQEAEKIGYPIMIKAVRGGGGKGMRIVLNEEDFESSLESARRESEKSFGDGDVLLEKFVSEPRHVEVQIFADHYGNALFLSERDCSVQRRHQKIIEEAPAPGLSDQLRIALGTAAVKAAKAVGYVGAGTVEFILDRNSHDFYFMEMNTRLQVEHPVTEMITGLDLVEWQIKVASGEKLPCTQEEIKPNGHAFESRIYAENPKEGFLPGAGLLKYLSTPTPSKYVRIDTGVKELDEVSVYYDPMIAKLITWGQNRDEALAKMITSLSQFNIAGLETNVNFLIDLCKHAEFSKGNVHTNFIRDFHGELFREQGLQETKIVEAVLGEILTDELDSIEQSIEKRDRFNPFVIETGFRVNYKYIRPITLEFNGKEINAQVKYDGPGKFHIKIDDKTEWKIVEAYLKKIDNRLEVKYNIDGCCKTVRIYRDEESISIFDQNGKTEFGFRDREISEEESPRSGTQSDSVLSPMPGIIDKVFVKVGDVVKKGDSLAVLIAMKMEYVLKAENDAKIAMISYKPGDNVPKDAILMKFEDV